VLLTATPQFNAVHDIVNLVGMIRGEEPMDAFQFGELVSNKARFIKYFACNFAFYNQGTAEYPRREDHYLFIPMTPEVEHKYNIEASHQPTTKSSKSSDAFMSKVRAAMNNITPCLKCDQVLKILSDGKKALVYSAFKSAGIEIISDLLKKHGISYLTITGATKQKERQTIVNRFNTGGYQVLFITKAAGEGLDLKGVRKVLILEKGWNQSGDEQVIGRAIRFRSHSHLPANERVVDVYHLVLIKQADHSIAQQITNKRPIDEKRIVMEQRRLGPTQRISADLYLMLIGMIKQKEMDEKKRWLEEASIFKNRACLQN
jgi:superfamily II DNA or RNA helicase